MDSQLVKRIKSFMWRGAMLGIAAFVDYALANLGVLELPTLVTAVLGLGLGELSKYLNTR
jgi:hypothetical protein